jgi:hypothetical protein
MKSSGGGRKRGRPVTLTPEQKLQNERERWRRKKARQRKATADAKWQCDNNSGYFVQLWVPHYSELEKALVEDGLLYEDDVDVAPRVDAAVDKFFEDSPSGQAGGYSFGRSRKLSRSGPGTVRIRMTADLADRLAVWGSDEDFEEEIVKGHYQPPGANSRLVEELHHAREYERECRSNYFSPPAGNLQKRTTLRAKYESASKAKQRLIARIFRHDSCKGLPRGS